MAHVFGKGIAHGVPALQVGGLHLGPVMPHCEMATQRVWKLGEAVAVVVTTGNPSHASFQAGGPGQ